MLKGLFLGVVSLFIFNAADAKINSTEEIDCRVTCTITVADGFGGAVGISATAGNIFTGCSRARERACRKAHKKIFKVITSM